MTLRTRPMTLMAATLVSCLLAARAFSADAPPIGPTKIPFYTGNLSIIRLMRHHGTTTMEIPSSDWASPERIATLKRVSCFGDTDIPSWSLAEQEKGKWDFGAYEANADLLHAAGLKYVVFSWVHFPPKWFMDSPEFVPYQCAEHGEKLLQLSPWAPNVWSIYRDYYSALHRELGSKVDWIRVGTPSDYGEIGYPAAMTSWLVPQKHAHGGYWCGDPYARADFRAEMKRRFADLKVLNKRWGTRFGSWNEVTYPDVIDEKAAAAARTSGKPSDRRRWLDFEDWYHGVWVRFVPKLCALIREFYPKTPLVVSLGYGSEASVFGNDYSALPKMARRTGIAVQAPGNIAHYAIKRVSTACRFYGCRYHTEPPGGLTADAEVARVWCDVSNGVQVYFEYTDSLDLATEKLSVYKDHMTGARPDVDFAIFNCTTDFRLHSGQTHFPVQSYLLGDRGRERFDYDVVDEMLVTDGALSRYRVLAWVQGGVTEASALRKIAAWVKGGGVLLTCDLGDVQTVEGDTSIWRSLMPARLPALAHIQTDASLNWTRVASLCSRRVGKGLVVQLPVKSDQTDLQVEAAAHLIYHLSDFGKTFRNAPLIDDAVDGAMTTLLPDRVLVLNGTDKEVRKHIKLRPEDWASRPVKPEKMDFDLVIPPHSIEAVMLR